MWHEVHGMAQVAGRLPLVRVPDQSVGQEVVPQPLGVVARRRLGARAGVSRHAEHDGRTVEVAHEGGDGELHGGGVAARVGDPARAGDRLAVQLGQAVGPAAVEAMVRGQVDHDHIVR